MNFFKKNIYADDEDDFKYFLGPDPIKKNSGVKLCFANLECSDWL